MLKDAINDEYFDWIYDLVCGGRFARSISYRKLLSQLHNIEFTWVIDRDENRAYDGIDLRYRFSLHSGYEDDYLSDYIEGPCSVLEMIVALSIRCEENIMDDPKYGDRTGQWFWGMINTLGLGSMMDTRFNSSKVERIIGRFLNREYDYDGKGGLFRIRNTDTDLRTVEIWYQLCWYLDTLT